MKEITRVQDFDEIRRKTPFWLLLFHTESSDASGRARESLERLSREQPDIPVYAVDARRVPEIHPQFNVTAVPTVLAFRDGRESKRVQGALSTSHYEMLLSDAPARPGEEGKPGHSVTVYTTPTCAWCTRVKSYLRKNRIRFMEIDISRDPAAADELVRRSGQMGVPQIDIDGQIIVGFDQARIDARLGIGRAA